MNRAILVAAGLAAMVARGENLVGGGDFSTASETLAPMCRSEEGKVSLHTENLTWNKCGKCEVTKGVPDHEHAGKTIHAANVLIGFGKDGKSGFTVEPNVRYEISFDLKGSENVKGVGCDVVCWTGDDYWHNRKNVKVTLAGGQAEASTEWATVRGKFVAPPDAKRAALRLKLWSSSQWPTTRQYKPGDWFLFDNVRVERSRKNLPSGDTNAEIPVTLRKTIALGEDFADFVSYKDGQTPLGIRFAARWRKTNDALSCDVAADAAGGEYAVGTADKPWSGDTVELQLERPDGSYKRTHIAFNNAGAKYTDAGEGRGNDSWEVRVKAGEKGWQASVRLPFSFLGITGGERELGVNVGFLRQKARDFNVWATGRDFRDPSGYGRVLFTTYGEELKREFALDAAPAIGTRRDFEREWVAAERKRMAAKFAAFREATFSVAPVPTLSDWTQPYLPEEVFDPPKAIALKAAVNEIRALPLAIANFTDRTEDYRVILETADKHEHLGAWGLGGFPAENVVARKGMRFKDVNTAKPTTRFDPLPRLDEAGSVTVPSREAGLVWYDFDCRGVKPGVYSGRLRVIPTCEPGAFDNGKYSGKMQTIPVTLEVVNAEISTHPAAHAQYYADVATEEDFELAHQIGAEEMQVHSWSIRYTQTPEGDLDLTRPLPPAVEAQRKVRERREWGRRRGFDTRFIIVYTAVDPCGALYGCNYKKKPELFRRIWPQYVKGVKTLMNGAGVPDSDYSIEVFDEPGVKLMPQVLEFHKLAKAACPTVRLAETLACWKPSIEDLKAIAPYCDRWMLWRGAYFNKGPYLDFVQSELKAGKEISLYSCEVTLRLPLRQYYREHAWMAERHGLSGADMYQLTDHLLGGGYGCKDFKSIPYGGLFYRSFGKPIPSLRFMALREGFTDCKFMAALRAKNLKANDPEITKFLAEAAIELMDRHPNDATLPDRLRAKARDLLAK